MHMILIVGIVLGLILVGVLKRRIPRWKLIHVRLSLLAVGLYGFVPSVLMRLGLIEATALGVALAGGYFLIFSVGSAVLLNGVSRTTGRLTAPGCKDC
jgi:hypothetical protein